MIFFTSESSFQDALTEIWEIVPDIYRLQTNRHHLSFLNRRCGRSIRCERPARQGLVKRDGDRATSIKSQLASNRGYGGRQIVWVFNGRNTTWIRNTQRTSSSWRQFNDDLIDVALIAFDKSLTTPVRRMNVGTVQQANFADLSLKSVALATSLLK